MAGAITSGPAQSALGRGLYLVALVLGALWSGKRPGCRPWPRPLSAAGTSGGPTSGPAYSLGMGLLLRIRVYDAGQPILYLILATLVLVTFGCLVLAHEPAQLLYLLIK